MESLYLFGRQQGTDKCERHEQGTDVTVERTHFLTVAQGFLHIHIANHLAVIRHFTIGVIIVQRAQFGGNDGTIVADASHFVAERALHDARHGVDDVFHKLTGQRTVIVFLIESDFEIDGIPFAYFGLALPQDGHVASALWGRLGDGGRDALDDSLDGVALALLFLEGSLLSFFFLGFDAKCFTGAFDEAAPLCFSGCAECKHSGECQQ